MKQILYRGPPIRAERETLIGGGQSCRGGSTGLLAEAFAGLGPASRPVRARPGTLLSSPPPAPAHGTSPCFTSVLTGVGATCISHPSDEELQHPGETWVCVPGMVTSP